MRELRLHWPDYRIPVTPDLCEQPEVSSGDLQWPDDIVNYLDLNTTINSTRIRKDVATFLHKVMMIASSGEVSYKIDYIFSGTEPDETVDYFYPIRIYTDTAECAARARDLFEAESHILSECVDNLLPIDLVHVQKSARRLGGLNSELCNASVCPS